MVHDDPNQSPSMRIDASAVSGLLIVAIIVELKAREGQGTGGKQRARQCNVEGVDHHSGRGRRTQESLRQAVADSEVYSIRVLLLPTKCCSPEPDQ
jgi:hypothetical protein